MICLDTNTEALEPKTIYNLQFNIWTGRKSFFANHMMNTGSSVTTTVFTQSPMHKYHRGGNTFKNLSLIVFSTDLFSLEFVGGYRFLATLHSIFQQDYQISLHITNPLHN